MSAVLAELNIRHTRRHQPTRRVALGDTYLPTSGAAFGAVLLAWAGCTAYFIAPRASPAVGRAMRTIAFRAFVASAALAITVAVLGTIVAVHASF